jgi:hypothetical protein
MNSCNAKPPCKKLKQCTLDALFTPPAVSCILNANNLSLPPSTSSIPLTVNVDTQSLSPATSSIPLTVNVDAQSLSPATSSIPLTVNVDTQSLASSTSSLPLTANIDTETKRQPVISFPVTIISGSRRSFLAKWYDDFTWLEYNTDVDAAFCYICRTAADKFHHQPHEIIFTTAGFKNWKKAFETFRQHERSASHVRAATIHISRLKNTTIIDKVVEQKGKEKQEALKCLHMILASVCYLARQGLAIRNKDQQEDGNLSQLLRFQAEVSPCLRDWLKRKTTWTDWTIQNELMERVSMNILRTVLTSMKNKYFVIIADETSDISRVEQLVVVIRHVSDDLEVKEDLLGLYSMSKCDSASIFAALEDVLLRCALSADNLRGQAYDGASTMKGEINGVAARFLEKQPRATYVHCQAHCLNLAVQDAVSANNSYNNFMNVVNDLINFVRHSPKRLAQFQHIAANTEDNNPTGKLRPLCPTRWTLRLTSLQSVKDNYNVLISFLEEMSNDMRTESSARSKASGFNKTMTSFDFLFWLVVSIDLFEPITKLSKLLQKPSLSAGEGKNAAEVTLNNLRTFRCDSHFNKLWEETTKLQEEVGANPPSLPRPRKLPVRYDGPAPAFTALSPEEHFRVQYLEVLDQAIESICSRFSGKGYKIIQALENAVVLAFGGVIDEDALKVDDTDSFLSNYLIKMFIFIQVISEVYADDVNVARLKGQLTVLPNIAGSDSVSNMSHAITALKQLGVSRCLLPDVINIVQLYMTLPSTSATGERTFSTLRRIKTYLRSTMSQKRLNHALILNVYKEHLDNVDKDQILREFISQNDMRRNAFALP